MKKSLLFLLALMLCFSVVACTSKGGMTEAESQEQNYVESKPEKTVQETEGLNHMGSTDVHLSGTVPKELEYIPESYRQPSEQPGTLEKLTYQTWESFSYEERTQKLTKEAWVYLPYGYSEDQKYNVFYLSHGGWSNETTVMGTDQNPRSFKYVIDHAIEDGKIQPLIIVLPTYNNTSGKDSGDYSLALQLTDQFHNELVNDIPHGGLRVGIPFNGDPGHFPFLRPQFFVLPL